MPPQVLLHELTLVEHKFFLTTVSSLTCLQGLFLRNTRKDVICHSLAEFLVDLVAKFLDAPGSLPRTPLAYTTQCRNMPKRSDRNQLMSSLRLGATV